MLVAASLLLGLFFSGPSPDDVNRAVKSVFEDGRLAREFPAREAPRVPMPDEEEAPYVRARPIPGLEVLLWIGIAVFVILVGVALARHLGGYNASVDAPGVAGPPGTEAGAVQGALTSVNAEALAAAGHYEDAIHLLLLSGLGALERRDPMPGSLTSREVLARASLSEEARAGLGELVRAVETVLFGARPATRETYERCLAGHHRLVRALPERPR